MFSLLQRITDAVRTSLWFIPLLMTGLAVGVAQGLVLLDQSQWLLYSSTVGKELDDALSVRFPNPRQVADAPVTSAASGYVQFIDTQSLTDMARAAGVVIRLNCRPGHHLIQGTRIASVSPRSQASDALCGRVNKAFTLGSVRTPAQDVLFLVNQLVEIAQRALSPGINDPVTATTCIDQLGAALGRVAACEMPQPLQADKDGDLRLVFAQPDTFKLYLDAALDPIRGLARSSTQVSLCLTSLLDQLAQVVNSKEHKEALLAQAAMIQRGAQAIPEVLDRTAVQADCQRIIGVLASRNPH